mgnify:CR=1 FL=1
MTPPIPQRPMLAPDILRLLRPHILDGAAWSREDCHLGAGVRFDAAAIIGGEVHGFEVKSEADSLARLKQGGMEVVPVPEAMMKDLRARTSGMLIRVSRNRSGVSTQASC